METIARIRYRWREGCWAHTLVQNAFIERVWGKDWRQRVKLGRRRK